MGSVLRRLAGYLRRFWFTGEESPGDGGEESKGGRGGLAAIEGGKERTGSRGRERGTPRAVIGIPYSSDAAEDEDPEEEEQPMKRIGKRMFALAAAGAAAVILAA